MAVNVNTVYQRVLAIANKEQRGYITPQEFNTLANQAQLDIFEQYFYDINQFSRVPGNSTEHSDMLHILEEKLSPFKAKNNLIAENQLLTKSTFADGTFTGWTDATGNNSAPTVVANANNGYNPSLKLINDGEDDDPHVYEDVSTLFTSKEYRLIVKVSYANDPDGASDSANIKLHAYSTDGTNDGEYIFSTKAVSGGEYHLDFNPVEVTAGGNFENYRIAVGLDEDTNDNTEVHFSEISLFEIDNKTLPADLYRLGQVTYKDPSMAHEVVVSEVNQNEFTYFQRSPLTRATINHPIYVRDSLTTILVRPEPLTLSGRINLSYIRKPAEVKWTYNVIQGNALYNATASDAQDFELHPSEEKNLVMNILKLAGIMIEDGNLYTAASNEETKEDQQEKL